MNPFGGLDYFLLLLLVLLPVVICGLKGKQLRVCGMLVCAVMLLAIFRTLRTRFCFLRRSGSGRQR